VLVTTVQTPRCLRRPSKRAGVIYQDPATFECVKQAWLHALLDWKERADLKCLWLQRTASRVISCPPSLDFIPSHADTRREAHADWARRSLRRGVLRRGVPRRRGRALLASLRLLEKAGAESWKASSPPFASSTAGGGRPLLVDTFRNGPLTVSTDSVLGLAGPAADLASAGSAALKLHQLLLWVGRG